MLRNTACTLVWLLIGMAMVMTCANAAPPELRAQISLNGTWFFTPAGGEKTTITVPDYWDARPGFTTDHAMYAREVMVPAAFAGKRVRVEFDSVCQIAEVLVNGTSVGKHVGGWIPFSFDITDLVTPGTPCTLQVDVLGGNHAPIVNAQGAVQWPVGWYGHQMRWGINCDVWLRAYGTVSIEDAQIVTSYRSHTLTVTYTIPGLSLASVISPLLAGMREREKQLRAKVLHTKQ